MRYLKLSLLGAIFSIGNVHAELDVSCEEDCYEDARACSENSDFLILNGSGCKDEQIACRMSCNSGRKINEYRELGSFSYSFRPMWERMI